MLKQNQKIKYAPNKGRRIQRIKTSDIVVTKVVVNFKGFGFKTLYPNIFDEYTISGLERESELQYVMNLWNNDP